jgi:hypothetical protein
MARFTKGTSGNISGKAKELTDADLVAMAKSKSAAIIRQLAKIACGQVPEATAASVVRAGELILERAHGRSVPGDKSALTEPAPSEDSGKEWRAKLIADLERMAEDRPTCAHCGWGMPDARPEPVYYDQIEDAPRPKLVNRAAPELRPVKPKFDVTAPSPRELADLGRGEVVIENSGKSVVTRKDAPWSMR